MTEFELIAQLTKGAPAEAPDLRCGVGDDCAIIAGPGSSDWLVTADALLEGVHFRRRWGDLATLGRKALAANLSDIAAMGGRPRFYLVTMGLPRDVGPEGAVQLYGGMTSLAKEYGCLLIGGDTTAAATGLALSLTVIGEAKRGAALLRSGARPGDALYATGTLGGAALGLACLEEGFDDARTRPFVSRHLDPAPRIAIGEFLAGSGMVSAMIDVSDGLLADAGHIAAASGVGFEIEAPRVPRDPEWEAVARAVGKDPMMLLLASGEEYELLFTVKRDATHAFERDVRHRLPAPGATRIGVILDDARVKRAVDGDGREVSLPSRGFDHFAGMGN